MGYCLSFSFGCWVKSGWGYSNATLRFFNKTIICDFELISCVSAMFIYEKGYVRVGFCPVGFFRWGYVRVGF